MPLTKVGGRPSSGFHPRRFIGGFADAEKFADVLIHQLGLFLLHPMARVRDVLYLEWTSEQRLHAVSQLLAEREILLAPDEQRRRRNFAIDPRVRPRTRHEAGAEVRAIVVDRGGNRVGIAERGAEI